MAESIAAETRINASFTTVASMCSIDTDAPLFSTTADMLAAPRPAAPCTRSNRSAQGLGKQHEQPRSAPHDMTVKFILGFIIKVPESASHSRPPT